MVMRCFSRTIFLLFLSGLFCSMGCRAKQEAESISRRAVNTRPVANLPKSENSSREIVNNSPPAIEPAPTPQSPLPVVVQPLKVAAGQARPALEKTNEAMTDLAPLAASPKAPTVAPSSGSEPEASPTIPMTGAESPDDLSASKAGEAAVVEKSIQTRTATKRMMARVEPMETMEASPVPAPPSSVSAGDIVQPKNEPSEALPMRSASMESNAPMPPLPPLPSSSAQPAAGTTPPSADLSPSTDYATVKVFYGTDRAAVGVTESVLAKNAVYRSYLPLAVAAAVLTLLLAIVSYRLLRWRLLKSMAILSLVATVVLGAMTGYAAYAGRLPWETISAEQPRLVAYGDQRGKLELGTCEVSIPKRHEVGALESPSLLHLEFREDPNKHVVLLKVEPAGADEFYNELREDVAKSKENSALVFVHGYNVTFEDAARRTAQIAYDLKFGGVPLLYSWPSQGKLLDYAVDETNAVWTMPHLRQFLSDVARQSGAKRIHLIAHSMGNRALTGALRDLALQETDGTRPQFDEVLLTAPDIDADVFKNDIAPAITKTARRVTLYASSNDAALMLSKKLHGYPRAGEAGGDLVIVPGMDTVDVSAVDTSLLGHSYYGESGTVLADFVEVLFEAKPADQRKWLKPEFLGMNKYWVFQR